MSNIRFSGSGRLQPFLNQYYATSGNVPSGDILEGIVRGELQAAYANRNAAQELSMRKKAFDENMKEAKRARQAGMIRDISALGMFGLANIDKWMPYAQKLFTKEETGGGRTGLPPGTDYGLVNMNEGWGTGATGLPERKPSSTYRAPYAESEGATSLSMQNFPEKRGIQLFPHGKTELPVPPTGVVAPAVSAAVPMKSNIASDINMNNFSPTKDFKTYDELASAQRAYNKKWATQAGVLSPFSALLDPISPFEKYRASLRKPKQTVTTAKPFESSWSFGTPSIRR